MSNKEIAEKFNITHQKVSGIAKKLQKPLGDKVEAFTEATGIKAVVDKVAEITGRDCGCKKRKEMLNSIAYKLTLQNEPSEAQIDEIYELIQTETAPPKNWNRINKVYCQLFNVRYSVPNTACGKCLNTYNFRLNELRRVFENWTVPNE